MDINVSTIISQLTQLLRLSPNSNDVPHKELVDRCAFYLPTLRNIENVRLLTSEILFSPGVFIDDQHNNLDVVAHLIDAFQYSIHRKSQITDPLISYSAWIGALLDLTRTIAPDQQWRSLGLLSALAKFIFSNEYSRRDPSAGKHRDILLYAFSEAISNSWLQYKSSVTFSLGRALPELPLSDLALVNPEDLLHESLAALYELPGSLLTGSSETISYRYLNGYSLLIKKTIPMARTAGVFERFLETAITTVQHLSRAFGNEVSYLKSCLFGLLVQLEGLGTAILQKNLPVDPVLVAKKILVILGNLNQIVIKEAINSLDEYKFIYFLCIDVILSGLAVQNVLENIIHELDHSDPGNIFIIDLTEHLLPALSDDYIQSQLIPIISMHLEPRRDPGPFGLNLLESAHSVMLKIIVSRPSLDLGSHRYLDNVAELFPNVFNSQQFSIVMTSLAESMRPDILNEFLGKLFVRCKTQLPGIPLQERQNVHEAQLIEYSSPPTIRAALVSVFLKCLPYARPTEFNNWLSRLPSLLRPELIYNDLVKQEQVYLNTRAWDMISSDLSPELEQIGIAWWYKERNKL